MRKATMTRSKPRFVASLLMLLSAAAGTGSLQAADPTLQYITRGNYMEGIRPTPVSGSAASLDLISFRANHRDSPPATGLPGQYKVRFLLEQPKSAQSPAAFLTIRELRNVHYYWLDDVNQPWKAGANDFAWSTGTVLSRLTPPLSAEDLGVVVRVDKYPAIVERVAPAVLYHSRLPKEIEGYELWVVPSETARIEKVEVEGPVGGPPLPMPEPRAVLRWSGGQPLRITWNARGAAAGRYAVVITGYGLSSNGRLDRRVEFYHRPAPQ